MTSITPRGGEYSSLWRGIDAVGAGTHTFADLGQHIGLVVGVGGEDLGLLGWLVVGGCGEAYYTPLREDGGVKLNEGGHDATGASTPREREGVTLRRRMFRVLSEV